MFHFVTKGDATVGWGHAARTLALAEWAEKTGREYMVAYKSEELKYWPWPGDHRLADIGKLSSIAFDGHMVADGLGHTPALGTDYRLRHLAFIVDEACEVAGLSVNPNFGGNFGPHYYPLRPCFAEGPMDWDRTKVLAYRIDLKGDDYVTEWDRDIARETMDDCRAAVVPPSVVAYECMAAGVPVYLHLEGCEAHHKTIGDAMVDAGCAVWYGDMPGDADTAARVTRARSIIDGRGAERLLHILEAVL